MHFLQEDVDRARSVHEGNSVDKANVPLIRVILVRVAKVMLT